MAGILAGLFNKKWTISDLMNIDQARQEKSSGCIVSLKDLYVEIMQVIDVQPLVSSNGMLYFWNLNDYIEQKNIEEIPDAA